MDMANYSRAKPMLRDAAEIRWKTFESLKQPDSALFYLKMFKAASDTLSADKQLRNMEAVEWKAAGDRQQAEITLLGKEKLIHVKQKQILIILLASFSTLAFFVPTNIHLKRKREKARQERQSWSKRILLLVCSKSQVRHVLFSKETGTVNRKKKKKVSFKIIKQFLSKITN